MRFIVAFLDDHDVALPPKVLFENLKIYEEVMFSHRTVQRHLLEAEEMGLVECLDRGRSYYRVTDLGREFASGELTLAEIEDRQETDADTGT